MANRKICVFTNLEDICVDKHALSNLLVREFERFGSNHSSAVSQFDGIQSSAVSQFDGIQSSAVSQFDGIYSSALSHLGSYHSSAMFQFSSSK